MVLLASEICVSDKACLAWYILFHWATPQRPQSAHIIGEILMRECEGRGTKSQKRTDDWDICWGQCWQLAEPRAVEEKL